MMTTAKCGGDAVANWVACSFSNADHSGDSGVQDVTLRAGCKTRTDTVAVRTAASWLRQGLKQPKGVLQKKTKKIKSPPMARLKLKLSKESLELVLCLKFGR